MPSKKPKTSQAAVSRAVSKGRTKPKPSTAPTKSARGTTYQVKITLNGIRPPIWRSVQTKDCTLASLHGLIQITFGWEDDHLHVFEINGEQYGDPQQWRGPESSDEQEISNERTVKVSQLLAQGIKKFKYVYDMGDNWQHSILIEKTLPAESGVRYPCCIDGKRAGPPEDLGGAWGYGEFLEAIQKPRHKRHEEMIQWIEGGFDPEQFDLDAVNQELQEA